MLAEIDFHQSPDFCQKLFLWLFTVFINPWRTPSYEGRCEPLTADSTRFENERVQRCLCLREGLRVCLAKLALYTMLCASCLGTITAGQRYLYLALTLLSLTCNLPLPGAACCAWYPCYRTSLRVRRAGCGAGPRCHGKWCPDARQRERVLRHAGSQGQV